MPEFFFVKVHLIHFEAINEMRKEYQTAIVHQAKVQTVERVLNVAPDYSAYPRDVWSAMCPYLVLEVRRDFLVEDALEQLQKKVIFSYFSASHVTKSMLCSF